MMIDNDFQCGALFRRDRVRISRGTPRHPGFSSNDNVTRELAGRICGGARPRRIFGRFRPRRGNRRDKAGGLPTSPARLPHLARKSRYHCSAQWKCLHLQRTAGGFKFSCVWSVSPSFSMVKNAAFFTRISCLPFGIAPIQFCLPHDGWIRVLSVQLPGVATG